MRFLIVLVLLGATPAFADDDPGSITVSTQFLMGAVSLGDQHGFLAPGAHLDLGFRVRRWRLAAEIETGLWSKTPPPAVMDPTVSTSNSFDRMGMALRWTWKELARPKMDPRPSIRFRGYVEAGLGIEHISTSTADVSRGDVMLGVGVGPELGIGPVLFGTNFGVRMLISRSPATTIARGSCATCSSSGHDVAILYTFGFAFGH